jgi:hypothetical protein
MKVALLPKKTRGETVQIQMRLHRGDGSAEGRRRAAASPAHAGARHEEHDRQAFEYADRLRAKLSIGGSEDGDFGARTDGAHASPDLLRPRPKHCASRRSPRPSSRN